MQFLNGPNVIGTLDVSAEVTFPGLTSTTDNTVVVIDANGKLGHRQLNFNSLAAVVGTGVVMPLAGGTGLSALGQAGYLLRTNLTGTACEWVSAGGNRDWTVAQDADMHTSNYDNTNTQLSEEQVNDFVGDMLSGTQSEVTVAYDDTNGNLDFTVNLNAASKKEEKATQLECEVGLEDTKAVTAKGVKDSIAVTRLSDLRDPIQNLDMNDNFISGIPPAVLVSSDLAVSKFHLDAEIAGLSKDSVGLNNVDNTTDALKPVSTATQTALDTKVTIEGAQTITGRKIFSESANKKALHFVYTAGKFQNDTSDETWFSLADADRDQPVPSNTEDQMGVMIIVPLDGVLRDVIITSSSDLSNKSWEFRVYRVPSGTAPTGTNKIKIATVASSAGPVQHTNHVISFVTDPGDGTNDISWESGYDADTMFTEGDRFLFSLQSDEDASGAPKINSTFRFILDESTIS